MSTLVVVGACYLDTILTVPYYPNEDEKLRAASLSKRRGGNGPNTLEVLHQLITGHDRKSTLSLALCSVLPCVSSPAVEQVKVSLGSSVDLSLCIYRETYSEAASSFVIRSAASGSRTIVNHNNLPEMTLAEFEQACARLNSPNAWYHFEGRMPDVTLGCMRYLHKQYPEVTISVELEKPGRTGLEELASEADVVFHSQGWARNKNYNSARDCLQAQSSVASKASLLFCTWGAHGSSAFQRATGQIFDAPAFKIPGKQVVDSTGAGDAFTAAVLFDLISRSPGNNIGSSFDRMSEAGSIIKLLDFANEIAGRKVIQEGFGGLGQYGQEHFVNP